MIKETKVEKILKWVSVGFGLLSVLCLAGGKVSNLSENFPEFVKAIKGE